MVDPTPWIAATRHSHNRFVDLVGPLTEDQLCSPSRADEWSIADVASHLGSQAEIFERFVVAGRDGTPAPGPADFAPIWDRWNALEPAAQAAESTAANERLVVDLETMPAADAETFALSVFGMDLDLTGVVGLRLGEHALHTWDVAAALDPTATLAPDAVDLLIDTQYRMAGRGSTPRAGVEAVTVLTSAPSRSFLIMVDDAAVAVAPHAADATGDPLRLPAEAFIRLLAGRLDAEHTPAEVTDPRVAILRTVFTGF